MLMGAPGHSFWKGIERVTAYSQWGIGFGVIKQRGRGIFSV
jgi:hypothetical protein